MSNDFSSNTSLGDLDAAPEMTPQQKAAATRKRNAELKAAALVADAADVILQPSIKQTPKQAKDAQRSDKEYKFKPGEKRWITVQKERGKGGDRAVPVCVNGKQFLVPRGVRVQVPAMVAEVLVNAEETIVESNDAGGLDTREAQSYATAVHDG